MSKKKLVFLTGAGISAESGLTTFRDADGLWEQYPVMDVCSASGFAANPALIHKFYSERRSQLPSVEPNSAHNAIVDLRKDFDVKVITQNVDDLHERSGFPEEDIIHLHGELMKVRSTSDSSKLFTLTPPNLTTTPDTVIEGHHVRPHIVFFEEPVPMIEAAAEEVMSADIFVIIGTSLVVYPAAGLMRYARPEVPIIYIDLNPAAVDSRVRVIAEPATQGMKTLQTLLETLK